MKLHPIMVHRHAHGYLTTKGHEFRRPRSKNTKDRVRRWAKRVSRRILNENCNVD